MKTTKLYCARTWKLLATIEATDAALTRWCDAHGYLPHRECKGGWVVIA